jgi:hypothetical protein
LIIAESLALRFGAVDALSKNARVNPQDSTVQALQLLIVLGINRAVFSKYLIEIYFAISTYEQAAQPLLLTSLR